MTDAAPSEGRIVTRVYDHVLTITIDRPAKRNGFTPEMILQLAEAYTTYEETDSLWCAVLRAEGPCFTAGLQLDRFTITDRFVPEGLVDPLGLLPPLRRKPVVAAVHGICFTIGIELMLAADVVIAAPDTRFAQLEVKRGLMPFGGATMRMVERAGWGNAMRWLLTGGEFDGHEALRMGLVQELRPADEVHARALELAQEIAEQSPVAVLETRASALRYAEAGEAAAVADFPAQLRRIAHSEDFAEGVRSFVERRKARFTGR
ncbi:crotonase/enoyl-CoA hydratase family protein [Paraliomyxa miuraensis]|uniref:crotonase/enoyl-CoA hydratase family protein n=1 Tax=Paraliomyxa miuraensis TaxID=376150 RepID=UPI00224D1644|nr:crotonase/enoyl-CoA hydratase family protein [Paraliomyxa miuraensis]MCX4246318.1 crotonase/enoyl-CoA hydratase family protein [Paraliomyxa miuraensis]